MSLQIDKPTQENTKNLKPNPKIAIIGAGPSGCAVINAFHHSQDLKNYDLTCFEKQNDIGGMWNFDWQTGISTSGEPVHSSIYKFLWSNTPKENLEVYDYTFEDCFGKILPSFPPATVINQYITSRYKNKPEVMDKIRLNTAVRMVTFDEKTEKFTVRSTDLTMNRDRVEDFDYLFVCTGHYWNPKMVVKPGFENFQGRLMHSHDFKDAREVTGKTIVTVGSSISAEDIATQCIKYGAKQAYLSARPVNENRIWCKYNWPENMVRRSMIQKVEGKTVYFEDENEPAIEADAIIVCTGYNHYYPFLEEKLRLKSAERFYPKKLYKGVFHLDNPKLAYIGAQKQYYTFPMFDMQAWFARDIITGKIPTPSKQVMELDAAKWQEREEPIIENQDEMEALNFQTDMLQDYLDSGIDYFGNQMDLDKYKENFGEFVVNKLTTGWLWV